MNTDEVYQFFGSCWKASKAIGITKQGFSIWEKRGYIPLKQQIKIEKITKGKLIAREEDAKKPDPNEALDTESNYLPNFRYYDKKHGMCKVESIYFRKGKRPKITYVIEGNNREKFAVFSARNLMQASDLTDSDGCTLYEGDICLLENGDKFTFKHIGEEKKLKKLGKFKIIGNIFNERI